MDRELIKFYRLVVPPVGTTPKNQKVKYLEGVDKDDIVWEDGKKYIYGHNSFRYVVHDLEKDDPVAGSYVIPGNDDTISDAPHLYIRGTIKDSDTSVTREVFEMYVNPQRIQVEESKLVQKIRTRGGWVFQYWGPDISKITVTGRTGSLVQPSVADMGYVYVYDSPAYKALTRLRAIYHSDHMSRSDVGTILGMYFRRHVYTGHFDGFTLTEEAERPYIWDYSFTFSVHQDSASLSLAESRLFAQSAIDSAILEWLSGTKVQKTK